MGKQSCNMSKLSILAITLVVCLSMTADAIPNMDDLVPEEEASQIDAADLSHLTGGPVAATPGYDPRAIFKTLANVTTSKTAEQVHATLKDPSFPIRVFERTLVTLEEANPGLRTNLNKLKEIKLHAQMRITHITLCHYYAHDIASATSSAKGESALVQFKLWDVVKSVAVGAAPIAVQAVPGLDVAVDGAIAADFAVDAGAAADEVLDAQQTISDVDSISTADS